MKYRTFNPKIFLAQKNKTVSVNWSSFKNFGTNGIVNLGTCLVWSKYLAGLKAGWLVLSCQSWEQDCMVEEVPQVCACLEHPSQDVSLVSFYLCLSVSWTSQIMRMFVLQTRNISIKLCKSATWTAASNTWGTACTATSVRVGAGVDLALVCFSAASSAAIAWTASTAASAWSCALSAWHQRQEGPTHFCWGGS